MADNSLTIQVQADTSKLRADLAVAQAQVKVFGSELRAAAKASLISGDASAVASIAGSYAAAEANALKLKRAVAGVHEEHLSLSRGLREGAEGFEAGAGRFRGGVEGLFSNLPVSGKALGGAAAIAVAGAIYEIGSAAAEEAHSIAAVSSELGVSTGQMKAWTLAAGAAGVDGDLFTRSLVRLGIAAEKAADAQRLLAVDDAKILANDSGVVLRGGEHGKPPPLKSPLIEPAARPKTDDPKFQEFAQQRYEVEKKAQEEYRKAGQTPPTLEPFPTFLSVLANKMAGVSKEAETLRQDFAKLGGNAPVQSMSEALDRLKPKFKDAFSDAGIKVLDAATGKLRNLADIASDTTVALSKMDQAKATGFSRTEMGRGAINPLQMEFLKSLGEAAGGVFNTPASDNESVKKGEELQKEKLQLEAKGKEAKFQFGLAIDSAAKDAAEGIGRLWDQATDKATSATTAATGLKNALDGIGAEPGQLAAEDGALDQLGAKLKSTIDLAKQLASALGGGGAAPAATAAIPPFPAAPSLGRNIGDGGASTPSAFAWGGHIRGPGSSTSDSIHIAASDGEFMLKAASVDKIGLPTLNHMNATGTLPGYAMGGLVGALDRFHTLPSFAAGGAVGGGSPVHLHLGNQSYPLSGKGDVVGALVAEAHRQQMTSAGVKPSWFAGRPSGR